MERSSVFQFASYKTAMKHYLRGKKTRGALSRAAEALECQRSYLSRVMNSEMNLTPDQSFGLCHFLRFSPNERDYFQALVELERAGNKAYREHLQTKLASMKARYESIAERTKRPAPQGLQEALYFSGWQWSAIHMLTSAPEYQTVGALSEKLALPKESVQACLERLKEWGYVRQSGKNWEYARGEAHLNKDSPFAVMHNQNWRARAVLSSQSPEDFNIHFTNVQTVSRADLPAIKEMLLRFISDSGALMAPSRPEDAVVLTCDLFRL